MKEQEKTLVHGGDWVGFQQEYGHLPMDFSANISPLGLPHTVRQAIIEAISQAEKYPDPLCRSLSEAIAQKEGVSVAQLLCGNGAADLIFRIVWAVKPKKALLLAPCFAEYAQALQTVDCKIEEYFLREENGFQLQEDILDRIKPDTDMVFLCEPNNPTGVTTSRMLLEKILRKCRECHSIFVLDECFNDFLESPKQHSMIGFVKDFPELFLLKAFTKIYAMAGIRLGYGISSDEKLLEQMRQVGQPWAVSALAQAAGIAALKEKAYEKKVRTLIQQERDWMRQALSALGIKVIAGEANFLLFRSRKDLGERLKEKGILLRSCENYHGLDAEWYRTAVRTHRENECLLAAIKEVLR